MDMNPCSDPLSACYPPRAHAFQSETRSPTPSSIPKFPHLSSTQGEGQASVSPHSCRQRSSSACGGSSSKGSCNSYAGSCWLVGFIVVGALGFRCCGRCSPSSIASKLGTKTMWPGISRALLSPQTQGSGDQGLERDASLGACHHAVPHNRDLRCEPYVVKAEGRTADGLQDSLLLLCHPEASSVQGLQDMQ